MHTEECMRKYKNPFAVMPHDHECGKRKSGDMSCESESDDENWINTVVPTARNANNETNYSISTLIFTEKRACLQVFTDMPTTPMLDIIGNTSNVYGCMGRFEDVKPRLLKAMNLVSHDPSDNYFWVANIKTVSSMW